MSTTPGSVISAPRLGDAFPADDSDQSQIKTRRMNMDSEKPFDPSKPESNRRVQQPREEPTPPKDDKAKEEPKKAEAKAPEKKPAAAPEKKADKKASSVTEDLKDPAVSSFAKGLFGDRFAERLAKGAKDKPEAGKKEDKAKPAPAKETSAPADKKGVTVTKAPPRAGLTQDDVRTIAETAATAAVTATRATARDDTAAAAKASAEDPAKDLAPEDRRNYEIATYMAKGNGDRYSDLPGQMMEVAKQKKAYKEKWLEENAGEKFSWEDESHSEFLNRIAPEFDEEDFEDARIEMRAEKVADRRLEGANKRIRDLEQQSAGVGLKDTIEKETRRSLKELAESIAPDADWDLSSEEGLATVAEKEDLLGEIVTEHVSLLKDATAEAIRFYDGGGKFRPDPDGNKLHKWMVNTVETYEQRVAASDVSTQRNESGQAFLPRNEYYALPEAKRARHWTIKRDQVLWILKDAVSLMAKAEKDKVVAKLKRYTEARGQEFDEDAIVNLRKTGGAPRAESDDGGETPENKGESGDDDSPPATGDRTRVDTSGDKGSATTSPLVKKIMSKVFQRHTDKE